MQRDCTLRIAGRGRLTSFSMEYKTGGVGTSGSDRCHLYEDQDQETIDRPVVEVVLIRGTMTAQWYIHDILQPHVLLLIQRLPGVIFQQDNAQLHTARVSQNCLRAVTVLPWPTRSPDLSPIEHI
ncbi:transposable element Tcb2 transposase [Trichonephila clavipes]|nr:transposable element Tcb2 transposase [Trichonephila clavipes]